MNRSQNCYSTCAKLNIGQRVRTRLEPRYEAVIHICVCVSYSCKNGDEENLMLHQGFQDINEAIVTVVATLKKIVQPN